MSSWVDNDGRKWQVRVTMRTCRDVKSETGWDLANILNDGIDKLAALVNDRLEIFSVLCAICGPQMREFGMTDEDFGEAHAGDAVSKAIDAFLEALADFFPERQGKQLKTILAASQKVSAALATKADEQLEMLDISTLTKQVLNSLELSESVRGT